MALAVKKSVVVVVILLFSAASLWFLHARSSRSSYGKIQSTWDDKDYENYFRFYVNFLHSHRGYQAYFVLLWKHPNMDDKDARRRWYESFLPSTGLTDSGEPRLLHCYPFDVNGFISILTRAEALALASKPGIRRMYSTFWNEKYITSPASCGFETRARSLVRSRPAF
uniref:Inhibitor I9 domain-containing protein n=1 Tax=Leersia perrieri TaxID=77586 RepID=A0A0D9X3K9_9ORYZ